MTTISPQPTIAQSKTRSTSQETTTGERPVQTSVCLLGVTYNTDNYGVRVLLSGAVDALMRRNPDVKIAVLDYGREPATWTEETAQGKRSIPLINLRFSWKLFLPNNVFRLIAIVLLSRWLPEKIRLAMWRRNPWLDSILNAQTHYSLAGGDSFSDIYGLRRLLYVTAPQILVLLMQRDLVLLPQTYGPFKTGIARALARWIIRHAKTVYSRDEAGVAAVHKLVGSKVKIRVTPDLGFGMTAQPLGEAEKSYLARIHADTPLIGLNVSKLLYMGGYNGKNMFGLREPFPQMIDGIIEYLVQTISARVILIPHVCGPVGSQEDETRLCEQLAARFAVKYGDRVCYLESAFNHRQIKSVIGACDLFLGARMHACIGAVSQGVPTICLAYSDKFAGVMKPMGAGVEVMDLRTAAVADVSTAIRNVFAQYKESRQRLVEVAFRVQRELIQISFN